MSQKVHPNVVKPVPMGDEGYNYAHTPKRPLLGVGGRPRAEPFFCSMPENNLRNPRPCFCWKYESGPNVPLHWYDGGDGWVTNYFTDVTKFSWENKVMGMHRCQVGGCNFEVKPKALGEGQWYFCPCPGGPEQMSEHLEKEHGIHEPGKREWSTGLCNTTGWLDICLCTACQGGRQMMAFAGHADKMDWWWCAIFCLLGCRCDDNGGSSNDVYWSPPWNLIAFLTRYNIVELNRIDESRWKTVCTALCCPCCSIGQSYRELTAAGVWPGGILNKAPPSIELKPLKMT